ncbi:hypothetical protein FOG48_03141 [Hanseniaspora uvarum]|nr:hypothetical protein FOG48_03141 [Hanseniaspora uvarum]
MSFFLKVSEGQNVVIKSYYRHTLSHIILSSRTIKTSAILCNSNKQVEDDKLINPYGIQCLQPDLKEKVFGKKFSAQKVSNANNTKEEGFQRFKTKILKEICDKSLENFELKGKRTSRFDPVNIKNFPDLEGPDLESHFLKIGKYLAEPYTKIIDESLAQNVKLDNSKKQKGRKDQPFEEKLKILPTEWLIEEGWVKYSLYNDQPPVKVDYPSEKFLSFDVETLPQISNYPVMATAKSTTNVYYAELTKKEASKIYTEMKSTTNKENTLLKKDHRKIISDLKAEFKVAQSELNDKNKEVHRYEQIIKDFDSRIKKFEDNKIMKLGQIENAKKETYEKMMIKLNKEAAELDVNPVDLSPSILQNLCPVNPKNEQKVIIGHNVSYDRARILEEYNYAQTNNFFMDTLSLHVAVSGMCSKQRLMYFHYKKLKKLSQMDSDEFLEREGLDDFTGLSGQTFEDFKEEIEKHRLSAAGVQYDNPWISKTSMNSLKECAKFYLEYEADKDIRDVFVVSKTYKPVVDNIQNLITYCASDTLLTEEVFKKVYPEFKKRLPHPVSTAALKSMGQAFLPVNNTKWNNYINNCENMYLKFTEEIQEKIESIIKDLLVQYEKDKYFWVNDPWLSQLEWDEIPWKVRNDGVANIVHNRYAGKPLWYKGVCKKPNEIGITVASKLIPIFFKLKYMGKPVIFENVWMDKDFLISKKMNALNDNQIKKFFKMTDKQLESLKNEAEGVNSALSSTEKDEEEEETDDKLSSDVFMKSSFAQHFIEKSVDKQTLKLRYCLCFDVEDPEEIRLLLENKNHRLSATPTTSGKGKRFLILHPDDELKRVTRLVSKAFKPFFDNGTISSELSLAKEALDIVTKCSYWVSNRKRIMGQWVVNKNQLLTSNDTNKFIKDSMLQNNKFFSKDEKFEGDDGMILPGLVTMGTVTRRAVENTWLTASNIKPNRIGSELKSLVEAPEGYCFVGADVDSEELWIGSLIADSLYENHGSTPLGWMTLEGTKKEGTDMHTTTANILNTSRDNAKIFNYSRIYGAGKKFTAQLLKKLDPEQTQESCKKTTDNLYLRTKGRKHFETDIYYGGSESALFTKLTEIAEEEDCRTPVLKAKITECLSAENISGGNFITSRINWIIQSSGVDYLHLLITSMEYLIKKYNINARLVISIHDEIRFICKEEDKYRTAMALQISNIWTRAMFCQSLHIDDLPQSCAFFSGVDIDKVLRKEVDINCVTISNPTPVPSGEVLDIYGLTEKVGNTLTKFENKKLSLKYIPVDNTYRKLKQLRYQKTDTVNDIIKLAAINQEDESSINQFLKKMSSIKFNPKNLERLLSNMFLKTSSKIDPK